MKPEDRHTRDKNGQADLIPPAGMVAHRFDIGSDAFAVLEFPLVDFATSRLASSLTESERDVMRLILEGKTNSEIALDRSRAMRTVANQVASIFRKLKIGSRCELYSLAARTAPAGSDEDT
jgi:DNA-binding NarL/FixJ family response regulator